MTLDDVLNNEPIQIDDIDDDQIEFDLVDFELDEFIRNPFRATHADIDPNARVDIVKDGQVLFSGRWSEAQIWLDDNFNNLNGTYMVAQAGQVIHDFTIAH